MHRAALPVSIACLVLVALNFILDFKRRGSLDTARFEIDNARSEHEEWFQRAEEDLKRSKAAFGRDIAKALALVKEFQERSRSEAGTLEDVRKLVDGLAGEFERLKGAAEVAAPPVVEETPEAAEAKKPGTLADRFMDTSLEELEAYWNSMREIGKTYEGQLSFKLLSTQEWEDSSGFIHELEEHYGVQLGDEERALLELKFNAYRGIFNTSRAYYESGIQQRVHDLVEKNGAAAYADVPPPISRAEARNVMALIGQRMVNMRIMKADDPELYRAGLVHPYVAHSLVEEMKTFFEARAGK
jgi:hypothetical protein